MKVLWLFDKPLSPETGGTERITSLTIQGLEKKGHSNMAFLVIEPLTQKMYYDGEEIIDLLYFLKFHKVDLVVNQIGYSKKLLHTFLDNGGNKWKAKGGKIITCLHFDPKFPSSLYFHKGKTNKTFADWIQIIKLTLLNAYYESKQKKEFADIYSYLYNNSDRFVMLSSTHYPYIKNLLNRQDYNKFVAINNPLTFDSISDNSICEQKKNIVLVVARMSEFHKRIFIVLKTWKHLILKFGLTNWELKIVGDGPDLDRYKSYVKKENLKGILFTGQQTPEPYYKEAAIFLMTSSAEGWGLTLTESLQRGVVPIIMNSSPVFSEIIEDGISGILVKNNDITSFRKVLFNLITNVERRKQMSRNALKKSEQFKLETTIEKWENLLNSLAGK